MSGLLRVSCAIKVLAKDEKEDESAKAKAAMSVDDSILNGIGLSCYHYYYFHSLSSCFQVQLRVSCVRVFSLSDCLFYFIY